MEDLAAYNDGCKAVSLLITILAKVVIYRLLTRGRPWIIKHTNTPTHTTTHTHSHTDALTHTRTHAWARNARTHART